MNKHWVLLAVVVLAAIALTISNWTPTTPGASPEAIQEKQFPSYFVVNPTTTQFNDNGRVDYQFSATRVEYFETVTDETPPDDTTLLSQPAFTFFQNTGEPWLLTADQGTLGINNEDITLTGHVIASQVLPKGGSAHITTEALKINSLTKTAATDLTVNLSYPRATFSGTGLFVDFDAQSFSLLADVDSYYQPTRSQPANDQ